jgi:plastocyanin
MSFRKLRAIVRPLRARALLGMVVLGSAAVGVTSTSTPVTAESAQVMIVDNDGPLAPPGDANTGMWTFEPNHIAVVQGDMITFESAASNSKPHTVASITLSSRFPNVAFEYGTKFNSSQTAAEAIGPGKSWMLDTSTLDPGQYTYFCAFHPWMVGNFTVMPAQ